MTYRDPPNWRDISYNERLISRLNVGGKYQSVADKDTFASGHTERAPNHPITFIRGDILNWLYKHVRIIIIYPLLLCFSEYTVPYHRRIQATSKIMRDSTLFNI
jgi:hypothetical protein